MTLAYVSPNQMAEYRQQILLFAKAAPSVECVRSHFLPERNGQCDLTGAKEQEELFVLANRSNSTLKVSRQGMQIVANVVDIDGADAWYENLKEQRKNYRDRLAAEAQKKEEDRKASLRTVLVRKKSPSAPLR